MKRYAETKHGYIIDEESTDEDFKKIKTAYDKINCIICNRNTSRYFGTPFLGTSIVTINNKVPDNVFYINHPF